MRAVWLWIPSSYIQFLQLKTKAAIWAISYMDPCIILGIPMDSYGFHRGLAAHWVCGVLRCSNGGANGDIQQEDGVETQEMVTVCYCLVSIGRRMPQICWSQKNWKFDEFWWIPIERCFFLTCFFQCVFLPWFHVVGVSGLYLLQI